LHLWLDNFLEDQVLIDIAEDIRQAKCFWQKANKNTSLPENRPNKTFIAEIINGK
jgi:hypothetical protein